MIKVTIKPELLEKHRIYLLNKNIDIALQLFQRKIVFFNIDNLNKMVEVNKEKQYTDSPFFKMKITLKKLKKLIKQHIKFIDYLLSEVDDLKNCNGFEICNNLFLVSPEGLNQKHIIIKEKFGYIFEFLTLQSKIFNNDEKKECSYATELRKCLGYSEFANEIMNYYYKHELEQIHLLKDIQSYKNKLNLSGVPRRYSVKHLNEIKVFILEDIKEIKHYDKDNDVLHEFLQKELYQKINDVSVADVSGESIGIGQFAKEVRYIVDNAYRVMKMDRKFQHMGIAIRHIDIYHAKYGTEWGAYHFLMGLGIQSCPYCNRQYITPMYSENGKVRADLDHFYNKAGYPYFSISLYNLVPSCKFCNSSLKGKHDFQFDTNLSPYEGGFGDRLKFSYLVQSYEDFLGDSKMRIFLQDHIGASQNEQDFLRKAMNNAEIFQLENLYNYHTDELKGLIRKRIEYSDDYIANLIESYNEKLFRNENEVLEAILGYQVDDGDLSKKNLTKFTRDLCEELGFVFRDGVAKSSRVTQEVIEKYKKNI